MTSPISDNNTMVVNNSSTTVESNQSTGLFSNFLKEHYYACRLEMPKDYRNIIEWNCAKFDSQINAKKFISENKTNTIISRIITRKCANPFDSLEARCISDIVNFPVKIINK